MKKLLFPVFLFLLLLTTACNQGAADANSEVTRLQAANDSLLLAQSRQAAEFNEVLSLLNEVESSFSSIKEAENFINVQTNKETEISTTSKERITRDIQFITEVLQQNKQKISTLQSQVKAGKSKSTEMQRTIERLMNELQIKTEMVEHLQTELAKKDVKIKELDEAIVSLKQQLNVTTAEVNDKDEAIKQQDGQLHEAYYVFGTTRELKDNRIVTREGVLKGEYNKDYFIKIDQRKVSEIPFYTKRAKVLTTHPSDSYLLEEGREGIVLKITDAKKFWSISKFLVVQVK